MAPRQAIIYIGGDAPHDNAHAFVTTGVPHDAVIIAADSGWEYALQAGKTPWYLIGDMDSISPDHLRDAMDREVEIIEYSPDKDHTDTELALRLAQDLKCTNIHVVTGGGDRFDHVLAMVHSLVHVAEDATVTAHIGQSFVRIATPQDVTTLNVAADDTISLIPLGGHAKGVTTSGLKWNLTRSTLKAFESRGVSNVAIDTTITIRIRTGTLAIIVTPIESDTQ